MALTLTLENLKMDFVKVMEMKTVKNMSMMELIKMT